MELDFYVPPEHEVGVPAEAFHASGGEHGFVLTFRSLVEDRHVATARIRVPTSAILGLREELNEATRDYELEYGEIHRPRKRD